MSDLPVKAPRERESETEGYHLQPIMIRSVAHFFEVLAENDKGVKASAEDIVKKMKEEQ